MAIEASLHLRGNAGLHALEVLTASGQMALVAGAISYPPRVATAPLAGLRESEVTGRSRYEGIEAHRIGNAPPKRFGKSRVLTAQFALAGTQLVSPWLLVMESKASV